MRAGGKYEAQPFISFLTTAYRTEPYIAETIESVLAQTRPDWELIVVDNGNSDEMACIVEKFIGDPRITLIRQDNQGIRGGVTAAAKVATGRYLCSLNSDDQIEPQFCERVGALVATYPGIDAVGSDAEMFWDPDRGRPSQGYFESIGRKSVPDPSRTVTLSDFLDDGVPLYMGVFRRDVWDAHAAFDPAISDVEPDVALWLSVAAAGRDIRVLPDRLARIRLRSDSVSHDESRIEEFEERLQRAFAAASNQYPLSDAARSTGGMMRRLHYSQAMRRARSALLGGDVGRARAAAREAYHHRHTVRAAALVVALRVSPRMLKSIHPTKNRIQNAWFRTGSRIKHGRAR